MLQHFVHELLQHKMQQGRSKSRSKSARGTAVNHWELCTFRWAERP